MVAKKRFLPLPLFLSPLPTIIVHLQKRTFQSLASSCSRSFILNSPAIALQLDPSLPAVIFLPLLLLIAQIEKVALEEKILLREVLESLQRSWRSLLMPLKAERGGQAGIYRY